MFGCTRGDDLSGREEALTWVAPEDREAAATYVGEVLEDGFPRVREFNLCRYDGKTFTGEVNAAALNSPEGPRGMVLVVRDVSDRKRIEEEKAKLEEQLASPEDGSHRDPGRRHRSRLQQYPHRHRGARQPHPDVRQRRPPQAATWTRSWSRRTGRPSSPRASSPSAANRGSIPSRTT